VPSNPRVELLLDGDTTWTDVTSKTRVKDGISISRGRPDEAQEIPPATCQLTLDNRDGRFSLRNPTGTYYGKLRRNTPLRVTVDTTTRLLVPTSPGYISAPDSTALSITGDVDLRIDATLPSWRAGQGLLGKFLETGNQRSYALYLTAQGTLRIYWSTDGVTGTYIESAAVVPIATGRLSVRATLDVDNGASGKTATFYVSTGGVTGTWTQLGAAQVVSGTTSIFNSTSPAYVGSTSSLAAGIVGGRVHAAQIRSGIGGTVVANPDLSLVTSGVTSFADSAAVTWTQGGSASITAADIRFTGEVAEWPPTWDQSGRDVNVPVTAAGLLRRLGQGSQPLRSAMYRGVQAVAPVAWWPLEDGSDVASGSSAVAGGRRMAATVGSPGWGTNSSTKFPGSDGMVALTNATLTGTVANYVEDVAGTSQIQQLVSWANAPENNGIIMRVFTGGTGARWDVTYTTGGALTVTAWDGDGTLLGTGSPIGFDVDGTDGLLSLELTASGSNGAWRMTWVRTGLLLGGTSNGTITGAKPGRVTKVVINPKALFGSGTGVAHVWVQKAITTVFALGAQINGWKDETAGRRIERLCDEESITFAGYGDLDDTTAMGAQQPAGLRDLLRECADADDGILADARDQLAVTYRPRTAIASHASALTIAYADVSGMEPVEDDALLRNDVSASRGGGGSARSTLDDGTALSVSKVGRYADDLQVNVAADSQLDDVAGFHLALGTANDMRLRTVEVQLGNGRNTSASRILALSALDPGDQITITGIPDGISYDDVDQIVQGITEDIGARGYRELRFSGAPAGPWQSAVWGDSAQVPLQGWSRYTSDGSYLAVGAYNSTTTGFYVSTPAGPLWTTDSQYYPLDFIVGGERVTVTAVTGFSATVQIFTVVRSVNGVVKGQALNERIELADLVRWGM
jgi:hypothetical protein